MIKRIGFCLALACALEAHAAEVIPPKPDRYFNDYANVVSKDAALRFNDQLAQFERDTSNQVVVAIFPKMQTDSDIADYTQRISQAWGVGQQDKRNGVVLFVFVQDRKMFVEVGYGLEGALPDATAFDITEFRIKPHFKSNDFEGGLAAGIDGILQAIRGEYQGTGKTVAERNQGSGPPLPFVIFMLFWLLMFFLFVRGILRSRRGYRYSRFGGPYVGGWSSGGGSGGGWSSGGGGGGFSGGGGSFGGGGAGSSW